MDPNEKVALVTGGASGIGLACIEELLASGSKVSIIDKNAQAGKKVLDDIEKKFGRNRAVFIETDVLDPVSFEAAFKKTFDTFKGLDIVINCAGISDFSRWELEIGINLTAVVRGTMLALEKMGKNKGGKGGVVINIASILGLECMAGLPVYSASKHGVVGLSRSFGMPFHFERTGVRVLAMCPGVTDTALVAEFNRRASDDIAKEGCRELNQLPQQVPEDVAKGVLHMIRYAANGSVWVSEGGEPVYEVRIPHREEMKIRK
ncbi:15-hydroxyprostaglandin dehydrogenase [NAD(+)] isoform X1 [Anabrus simplex]|uniref:15-hydroxyprostaglandin dehydrogenase [NAD(+)] isoform X1 n=1 Tax=Anabrus simplex TaxID=316456 RepID=UPI0035A32F72